MTTNHDRLIYGIAGVLLAMGAFYALAARPDTDEARSLGSADASATVVEAPLPAPSEAEEVAAQIEAKASVVPKPPAAPKPLSYEKALELYGGYRIQFVSCHGNPGRMVLGKGAKFMLDNRDKASHTVKVGSTAYRIAGLDFVIATAREIGTLNVTCDGGGAAVIEVQP